MSNRKISETMWCFYCEHEWDTDDYFNCEECPNCKPEHQRIYRTSSFSFTYAWLEKHPEERKKMDDELARLKEEHSK